MTTNTDRNNIKSNTIKPTLIVLLGPTGVGKTNISLEISKKFNAPIVSSDSRQFYKELKIGTAAPTEAELSQATHYFIGTHSIYDEYNAGQYEQDVIALLEKLFVNHDNIMLVGGSMMYIDAVCNGMDELPAISDEVRNHWLSIYNEQGLEYIQLELKKTDPVHYETVDLKNYKRVLHALEICSMTGKTYSEQRTGVKKKRNFNVLKIGLNRPRPELYERINQRVEVMMEEGLLKEAQMYYADKNLNTLNTVGYKELYAYMDGKSTLDEAVQMIKQDSRRYAKRQLTWFNRDKEIHWFHPDQKNDIISFITHQINK